MEDISKLSQPLQTTTLVHSKVPLNEIMKKVIEEMEKGKDSVHVMRTLMFDQRPRVKVEENDNEYYKALDDHYRVVLTTIVNSLSLLKSCDFEGDFTNNCKLIDGVSSDDHCGKSEVSSEDTPKNPTTRDRRGCYKRRRTGESREEEVTHLTYDGHAWRKYGQKVILNTEHPRNYYRCTHKFDQNCQATKQVQQISENPPKYRIVYQGDHTCNNILRSTPIVIDSDQDDHSSAIYVNFESNGSTTKHPLLFPASAFPSAVDQVTQEDYSVKDEMMTPVSQDSYGTNNLYSSSADDTQCSSKEQTAASGLTSTPGCDHSEVISAVQNCSSTASSYGMEDDYYSSMWADFPESWQEELGVVL